MGGAHRQGQARAVEPRGVPGHRGRRDRRRPRAARGAGSRRRARTGPRLRLRCRPALPRPRDRRVRRGPRLRHLPDDARQGPRDRPRRGVPVRAGRGHRPVRGGERLGRPRLLLPGAAAHAAGAGARVRPGVLAGRAPRRCRGVPDADAALGLAGGSRARRAPGPGRAAAAARDGDARDPGAGGARAGLRRSAPVSWPPTRTPAPGPAGTAGSTSRPGPDLGGRTIG